MIKKKDYIYDPDIVSFILIILGAISAAGGAASGIIAIKNYNERKQDKVNKQQFEEKKLSEIKTEVERSYWNLSDSITRF